MLCSDDARFGQGPFAACAMLALALFLDRAPARVQRQVAAGAQFFAHETNPETITPVTTSATAAMYAAAQ